MKILLSLSILLTLCYTFWFFAVQFGSVNIANYKGEGHIEAIGGGFWGKGVQLILPVADASEKIFSLNGLPITGRDYHVILQVSEKLKNKSIIIRSYDKDNKTINEFMIKTTSAKLISYDEKTTWYYIPYGYIPKDKIKNIDKLLINSPYIDSINTIKVILRSGGSV